MSGKGLYVARPDGSWWYGSTQGPKTDPSTPTFVMDTTRPSQTNTGLAVNGLSYNDLTLYGGDMTISTDNTVVDGMLIRGLVNVTANNVTFRNCAALSRTVTSSPRYAVIQSQGTGTVIENCEVSCLDDSQTPAKDNTTYIINGGIKVISGSAQVKRVHIHDVIDAGYFTGGTVEASGNLIRALTFKTDDANQAGSSPAYWSHNDGFQLMGGNGHYIHGNSIDMAFSTRTGSSSTNPEGYNAHGMLVQSNGGSPMTGVKIEYNWFRGGVVCILYSGKVSGSTASMLGNRFTPNQGTQFGSFQQMSNDPNSQWTVTGTASTVYSDDDETPSAWQGMPIKAPTSGGGGTITTWAYNLNTRTP